MQITNERQHMTKYWPNSLILQWSRQAIITVSRSTWKTKNNNNGVATDRFWTSVIGHPRHIFLN